MPHYYFDTSALVKQYHGEAGSHEVSRILSEASSVFSIARLTLAEMISVFAKKVRMGEIRDPDFDVLKLRFSWTINCRDSVRDSLNSSCPGR